MDQLRSAAASFHCHWNSTGSFSAVVRAHDHDAIRATVGELARRMQLAQSTVTELVNGTERAGLVRRTASNLDGRVAHIALTKEGEERFAASFRALADERRALRKAVIELDS